MNPAETGTHPRLVANDGREMLFGEFFPFPIEGAVHDVRFERHNGSIDICVVHPDDAELRSFTLTLEGGRTVVAELTALDETERLVRFF